MSPRNVVERSSPRSSAVSYFAYFFGGIALAFLLLLVV